MKYLSYILYWLTLPVLAVVLHGSFRTRVVIVYKSKVLIIRPYLGRGKWDLPGGGLKKHEKPTDGAIREVKEELGITLKSSQLQPCFDWQIRHRFFSFLAIYFLVRLDQKPKLTLQKHEIAEAKWVTVTELSEQQLAQSVEQAVRDCLSAQ